MSRSITGVDNITSSSISTPGTTGTIFFWLRPNWNSGDSSDHWGASYYISGTITKRIQFEKFSDNICYFGFFDTVGNNRITFADTGLFTSGTWTNIALTWNNLTPIQTAYVKAVSKGTNSSCPNIYSYNSLEIGNAQFASLNSPVGTMADFALWSVILTAAELTALNQGARPGQIRPAGLQIWYPLDGLQSPEPDFSGNAHNGTLNGTSLASGPPVMMLTPRWPQTKLAGAAAAASGIHFRRTLSPLGTRAGSRQAEAA